MGHIPFLNDGRVMRVRIRSNVTDRIYEPDLMVYVVNPVQTAKYLKHGAVLYDLLESGGNLVAVFSKKETGELYRLWQKHELE